jgi:WD40 repeat protein
VAVWGSGIGQELSRRETTNQSIRRVAVSPDGQRLVAVAERAAWVWALQSGELIRMFPDESVRLTNRIDAVFADDTGKNFATIDSDRGLSLWTEGRSPQHLITIRGSQPSWARRVFFSRDGRWLANAGEENTAHVWDLAAGNEHLSIGERVHQVAFSRDGNRMVTGGAENWITTWDLVRGRKLKVLRGHLRVANAVSLSLDGRLAASADDSGIVKVWSAEPGRELAQDRAWQWASTFSPDGRLIANCAFHEGVIIRSVRSGRGLLRIHPPNESFQDAAFSPDSRRLVTVGTQKTAKVWDVETGELLLRLRGHRRQIPFGVAWSPDGRWIAAGSLDGTAKVWDAHTGEEWLTLFMDPQKVYALTGTSNLVGWVAFDDKGERLLTGSYDDKVRIWEIASGRLLAALDLGKTDSGIHGLFLPDQRHLITSADNRIQIWEVSTGRLVTDAAGRGAEYGWDVSRDGRRMFTASAEGPSFLVGSGHSTLEIWDIEGPPRRILDRAGREPFLSLALSPDGHTVTCPSMDLCVYRWETFPWREEPYAEVRGEQSELRGQRSEIRGQTGFAERVRRYARRYWRERLELELNGAEGEPAELRVIEVPIDRTLLAKRDPRATANEIDLTDFYTGELGETFHGQVGSAFEHDNGLPDLPLGLVKLGGVEFDVRGVIQVRRAEPLGGGWEVAASDDPVRVEGIPVQQEAAQLHLLLGTILPEAEGTVIGRLGLRYADGETRLLDLVYGRDVREWWYEPTKADVEPTDRAKVVWTGSNPVANEYGRRLRLYLNSRENPRPGVKIATFDFVSTMSKSAPFLIAVTVE